MERERIAREKDEQAKAEKAKKIKETFGETNSQWEKDKSDMQHLASKEKVSERRKAGSRPRPGGIGGSPKS
jgi:mannan polymerase II complex ANP1 subunit